MFKKILVPTDGSEVSSKAIQTAIHTARLSGGALFALSVKDPFPYSAISEMQPVPPQEFFDAQERIAVSRVKEVIDAAKAAGVPCTGHTVEALHPWEAILDHARAHGVRPDRHGFARTQGPQRHPAGQRDATKVLTHTHPARARGALIVQIDSGLRPRPGP